MPLRMRPLYIFAVSNMAKAFTFSVTNLRVSKILMISTIVLIAGFQYYWINKLYHQEWDTLKKETDVAFRDAVYKLQLQRFRKDTTFLKKGIPDNLFVVDLIDSLRDKFLDSIEANHMNGPGERGQMTVSISTRLRHDSMVTNDTFERKIHILPNTLPLPDPSNPPRLIKYFVRGANGVNTPLDIKQVDSAYKKELQKSNINIPFTIQSTLGREEDLKNTIQPGELKTSFTFVGLSKAYAYQASFGSPVGYIINKIKLPVIIALLLLAFTVASFVFLYRNLLAQKRLAAVKNEFISNITHELKTPIATVNVAIEALRNFNALQNPQRTREYLDISALELQRLSMLVDKVLKLSMFENKEIELNKETIDMHQLVAEVIASMKLQFDKAGAFIQLNKEGDDFTLKADRLHITSVLYNLLDNALKYSSGQPAITVHLFSYAQYITINIADNGIGIPTAYTDKIFEKFFRVPSGDHHNIKGYGLGLSYVHHIITKHGGTISVESTEGKGSTFTIKLPVT